MNQTIHRSEGHCRILEDLAPFAKRLISRDQKRSTFVARADQLEQHGGLGLIFGHVDKIVQDQQMIAIESLDCSLQSELAAGDLQSLDEIGGAGK